MPFMTTLPYKMWLVLKVKQMMCYYVGNCIFCGKIHEWSREEKDSPKQWLTRFFALVF